jgi:hypothetical protein
MPDLDDEDLPPLEFPGPSEDAPPATAPPPPKKHHRPRAGRKGALSGEQKRIVSRWFAAGHSPRKVHEMMQQTEGMPLVDIRTVRAWITDLEQAIAEEARTEDGYARIIGITTLADRQRFLMRLLELEEETRPMIFDPGVTGNYPLYARYLGVLDRLAKCMGHYDPEGAPMGQAAGASNALRGMTAAQLRALAPPEWRDAVDAERTAGDDE